MKKILIIVVLLLALVPIVPVSAGPREPVGEWMTWHIPVYSFPANEPFHHEHGWLSLTPGEYPIGGYGFVLEVDGVVITPSYKINARDRATGTLKTTNVFNFPDGMSGVHVFTGYYYVPCQHVLDYELGTCEGGGSSVLLYILEMTVTFE